MTEPVMFDEEDTDYMFTIGQIERAWLVYCNEKDRDKEFINALYQKDDTGFIDFLHDIIKERPE